MTRADLLVPELAAHDATGTHTRLVRDLLLEMGVDSVRIVAAIDNGSGEDVTLVSAWNDPADLVILQHGIGSLAAEAVIKRRIPCVVNYHNITPIEFVEPWDPDHISGLRWGRSQLHQLAPVAVRAIGVSRYNAAELRTAGFDDVRVAPVLWDLDQPAAAEGIEPHGTETVLFVGRLSANKCQHDLLAALALLLERRPAVRMVLVGSAASPSYERCLRGYAARLGVEHAVDFAGPVSPEALAAHYAAASAFVCLSEHEGFCVPIVEAMAAAVPVVAFAAAAVPETVADAGILIGDKRPATVAAALDRVLGDPDVRTALVDAGRRRAGDFSLDKGRQQMRAALEGLVAP